MGSTGKVPLTEEQSKRYKELFAKLDVNKDGQVEAKELASVLRATKGLAEKDVQGYTKVSHTLRNSTNITTFVQYLRYPIIIDG